MARSSICLVPVKTVISANYVRWIALAQIIGRSSDLADATGHRPFVLGDVQTGAEPDDKRESRNQRARADHV